MAFSRIGLAFAIGMLLTTVTFAASGTATYYTPPYVPSACYGYKQNQFPQGDLFAAASDPIYRSGAACGKCYKITCTGATSGGVSKPCKGGSVTLRIVDRCPSPACRGTFDLSAKAFARIANPDAGRIKINYDQVNCPWPPVGNEHLEIE